MARPRIRPEGVDVKTLPVQLPETLYDELEAHCKADGVSKAHVVRKALKQLLGEERTARERKEA